MLKVPALLAFSGFDDGSNSNVYLLLLFQEQLLIDMRIGTFSSLCAIKQRQFNAQIVCKAY